MADKAMAPPRAMRGPYMAGDGGVNVPIGMGMSPGTSPEREVVVEEMVVVMDQEAL